MGRKVAIPWHALFSIAAGVLYFFFVLPRWPELMGDTTHTLGNALRIVTGALLALAALPVVFTLLRTRKPELGTPQLALSMRLWSIVAHVLAGVLIIGTAISEYWLTLDAAGQYLFGIYGAAAAIGVLGFVAFYLSFVAELPPPPPKPIKPKKPQEARSAPQEGRRRRHRTDRAAGRRRRRSRGDGCRRNRRSRGPGRSGSHGRSRRTAGGSPGGDRGGTGDHRRHGRHRKTRKTPKTPKRHPAGCVTAAPRARGRIGYDAAARAAAWR